jgi:hypothetical protein
MAKKLNEAATAMSAVGAVVKQTFRVFQKPDTYECSLQSQAD